MTDTSTQEILDFTYSRWPIKHGVRYTACFNTGDMSCDEVQSALAAPIVRNLNMPFDPNAFLDGLQQYGPNGIVTKNAETLGREVRGTIREMYPDVRSLFNLLGAEANEETFTTSARMPEDNDQASLYARRQLLRMSARNLLRLCSEIDVPIDEIGLYRLKDLDDEDTELRMYHLEDLGADSEKLRKHLVTNLFKRIDLLSRSGIEMALVLRADLSPGEGRPEWLQGVQVGSLNQPLELNGDLPRWQVTFRDGVVAHRRVMPVFAWAAVGEDWRNRPYHRLRKKLDFRGGHVNFYEETRTLTHFSTILGAVLLAQQTKIDRSLDGSQVYRFFGRGFDPHSANLSRRSARLHLPPSSVASLPALLTTHAKELLATEGFQKAEAEYLRTKQHINVLRRPLPDSLWWDMLDGKTDF